MKPHAVPTPVSAHAELANADFDDAFAIDTGTSGLTARGAADAVFSQVPGWITGLLRLRDFVVRPLGLKATNEASASGRDRIGLFPIVSETDRRIVFGFDDAHLNFRIVVDVEPQGPKAERVIATTLVKRNNLFGRVYLAAVKPFHKVIVPTMLGRIARSQTL